MSAFLFLFLVGCFGGFGRFLVSFGWSAGVLVVFDRLSVSVGRSVGWLVSLFGRFVGRSA